MNKVSPASGSPTANQSAAVSALNNATRDACYGPVIGNELKLALAAYNLRAPVPMNNATDRAFLTWAQTSYPSYHTALQNCTEQTVKLGALNDEIYGDDGAVYIGAWDHIQPLIASDNP